MKHKWRSLAVALAVAATLAGAEVGTAGTETERPPACAPPAQGQPPQPPAPATVSTVGQAYYCIFDNHYGGPVLDSRTLLVPAFAAVTREMQRRGLDQPGATLPALTGRKDANWAAFGKVYRRIVNALPDDAARAAVGAAAIQAMVDGLNDNHARWLSGAGQNLVGLTLSGITASGDADPAATGPKYVNGIAAGGPAEAAGIKLGDEILAVDGAPLLVGGILNEGVLSSLLEVQPGAVVKLTAHRPATGETFTATVTAAAHQPPPRRVESRLVEGNIAYVTLPSMAPDLAGQVLTAIASLRAQTELRGVTLDLRGNGGGTVEAAATLLGALAHGKTIGYWCDVRGRCTPNRTDDSAELLNVPLVVLTDRRCASACEVFSSAVKDLKLGTLVGTRTAGAVSGPAWAYQLDNGTSLLLPKYHQLGANKQIVDTIGVAPDHYAPVTAADLSAGRDPGLAKAVSLL
ncbi:S41 family peptidase [Amycolatopsis sp. NPDC004747]